MNLSLENRSRPGAESKTYFESRHEPIDMAHLSTYTMGNKGLEQEVLRLFRRQSGIYFDKLCNARTSENWCTALHVLKMSASSVGAWRLETLAKAAEQLTFRKRSPDRDHYISSLREQIEQANSFIDKQP